MDRDMSAEPRHSLRDPGLSGDLLFSRAVHLLMLPECRHFRLHSIRRYMHCLRYDPPQTSAPHQSGKYVSLNSRRASHKEEAEEDSVEAMKLAGLNEGDGLPLSLSSTSGISTICFRKLSPDFVN